MSTDHHEPLRKVAILVASLDEQRAQRLLDGLPSPSAQAVAQLVEKLGDIDPEEQRRVVAEFRRHMAAEIASHQISTPPQSSAVGEPSGGVELDASLVARIGSQESTTLENTDTYPGPVTS
ncbi:MAG: hypothetical protein MI725_10105 [Pirellulales bacterium]|nr:hypothetical protein [Pirellulales bacterium]